MEKKRKYLFYSHSDKAYGIVRGFISKDEIVDILAPMGTGLVGKDIAHAVNRNDMKKIVKSSKEIDYKNYDTLIISSYANYELCQSEISLIINQAKKESMDIIYLGQDEEINKLLKSDEDHRLKYSGNEKEIETAIKRYNQLNLPLFNPQIPIVYIGGLLETIDSFDIGLQIKMEMERLDYKVSLLTKELDGIIFGAANYPKEFMQSSTLAEEQILSVNRKVQAVDYIEKPDIILMDIPRGMMQYSDTFFNSFGIYTYMIAKTLPPDYLILTIPSTFAIEEYMEDIDSHFKNEIGKSVDVFNITNAAYDIGPESTNDIIDNPLYTLEEDIDRIILENERENSFNLVNLNKRENIRAVINAILEKFS